MCARKGAEPTISVHPRIPVSLDKRITKLKDSGPCIHDAKTTFIAYLIELGATRYANFILPAEMGDDQSSPMENMARTVNQ